MARPPRWFSRTQPVGGWYGSEEKLSGPVPGQGAARGRPETPTVPLRLRPCFVHDQMAVEEEAPVQHLDRLRGGFRMAIFTNPNPCDRPVK